MNLRYITHSLGWTLAFTTVVISGCTISPSTGKVNDPVFMRRLPHPGMPTFFQTIGYIDGDLRYADPTGKFFVSSDGQMCFRGVLNVKETIFDRLNPREWCVSPMGVGHVELAANSITARSVQLACKHGAPECAWAAGYPLRQMNAILLPAVRPESTKFMIEHLVYLLGGAPAH